MNKKMNSRDRRHEIRKRQKMKHQYAFIRTGAGINPLAFIEANAGLICVRADGIRLYS